MYILARSLILCSRILLLVRTYASPMEQLCTFQHTFGVSSPPSQMTIPYHPHQLCMHCSTRIVYDVTVPDSQAYVPESNQCRQLMSALTDEDLQFFHDSAKGEGLRFDKNRPQVGYHGPADNPTTRDVGPTR